MVVLRDVGGMENPRAPFVVDVEGVDWEGHAFDKVGDDEDIVDAIAVGGNHRGEFKLVVDDDDFGLDGVGALNQMTAGTIVVGTCDEADCVGTRDVFIWAAGRPLVGWALSGEGLEGVGVLAVLYFPEVFVVAIVGSGGIEQCDAWVLNGGIDGLPVEGGHGA